MINPDLVGEIRDDLSQSMPRLDVATRRFRCRLVQALTNFEGLRFGIFAIVRSTQIHGQTTVCNRSLQPAI